MPNIIGIDPGLDGAVAWLGSGVPVPLVADCPTIALNRRDYSVSMMLDMLRKLSWGHESDTAVFIEKISAGPFGGQKGAMGMMGYGKGYGIWLGICAALHLPVNEVSPVTWKKLMLSDMPKGKDSSRMRAMQLWPCMTEHLSRKKDDGRAEALLIAEYGRRVWGK